MIKLRLKIEEMSIPEPNSGCWIWLASLGSGGYGQIYFEKKLMKAHRAAWVAYRGEIPDNLWVLHRCDNRPCVNPDHLFLGTASDNMQDMIKKGRKAPQYGAHNSRVVLTDEQVAAIRAASGSRVEVAARFGTSPGHVSRLVLRTRRNFHARND